jgi:cytoskeletal protein RodZ
MTAFTHKKLSSSKSLPEVIKTARLKNNLSLEELALKVQISGNYLKNLEAGDYQLLPGEIYARQFIKKLAKFFHLNEKGLLEIYQKDLQTQPPLIKLNRQTYHDGWLSPKTVRLFFIFVLVIGFAGYFTWEIKNIFTPPVLEIYSPAGSVITKETTIEITGKTEPETTVKIDQQEILTEPDGSFSELVDLTIGVNTFKISASKKHTLISEQTISILRQPVNTAEINLINQRVNRVANN